MVQSESPPTITHDQVLLYFTYLLVICNLFSYKKSCSVSWSNQTILNTMLCYKYYKTPWYLHPQSILQTLLHQSLRRPFTKPY